MKVIRDGMERIVDVHTVVVGDVALLEPGEIIPCDGVFLAGHNVRCDESGATGESDAIRKVSYEDCLHVRDSGEDAHSHQDCFMVSGSKVLEGYGLAPGLVGQCSRGVCSHTHAWLERRA